MFSPIREELGALQRDPVFVRSPAMSRLLAYLVDASARGEGPTLKSYTVAVEGMGKSADFDPQINTSARVLVARLRRALDAYYAGAGADRAMRLAIENGSYEVRLQANPHYRPARPVPDAIAPAAELIRPAARPWWQRYAALLLAALAIGMAVFLLRPAPDDSRWLVARFPSVYFDFEDDGSPLARSLIESIRPASIEEIGRYEVIRPAYRRDKGVNYLINLRAERAGNGIAVKMVVADMAVNRIIYDAALDFTDRQDFDRNGLRRIHEAYFNLLGYRGVIVSQERKRVGLDEGAYGCWLRFSADALSDGGLGDGDLDACARSWHEHAPDNPVGTAIHAWTLVNGTLGDSSAQGRQARLNEAAGMLERARTLNPNSRHVLLSLARTYAFQGDFRALNEVSATLEEKGRYNLDIMSTVGTLLVLQDNRRGTELIDHAISLNPDPPARYYLGKFITAMMDDDTAAVGDAIEHIQTQDHVSLLSLALKTAYEARTGNLAAARASWAQVTEKKPALRLYPGAFLASLPASPPVRDRLRNWMRPVVPGM